MTNITHIIPHVGKSSFGVGPVALNLAERQNYLGFSSNIWCIDKKEEIAWATESSGLSSDLIRTFKITHPKPLCLSFSMEQYADRELDNISIVHYHALWTGLSRVSLKLRKRGVPSVITPHGCLQRLALNKSWWKKKIALKIYENKNLKSASCFHAVGENEVSDIRNFDITNPIAVIPNGISDSWLVSRGDEGRFRSLFHIPSDKRIILFLSRITPIKGLPMFIEALYILKQKISDWIFVIAGYDEFGHLKELKNLISQKRMEKHIIITGPLYEQNKRDAFEAADFFILPSLSEGAPIVILEALGAGLPVMTTKASPWEILEKSNCGWWVEISASAIADTLDGVLSLDASKLKLMGQRGKSLVAENYTWHSSALKTIELYLWLMNAGKKPDFVIFD